jgi:mono/diheme cytochrome c family protein
MPPRTTESIELGRKAFLTEVAGCHKCHGEDGRGKTTENLKGFQDAWGLQTRAADLTSGMLRGGDRPLDIYRRIVAGINGTPMPGFKEKLSAEPDTIWHLVHYVEYVAGARRRALAGEAPGPDSGGE